MSIFASLDWLRIREQYEIREQTHFRLIELQKGESVQKFVDLLLGVTDPAGNYSASEYGLGPKILIQNPRAEERVAAVARQFLTVTDAHDVPPLIRKAQLKNFQIGVGSEASCMMNPKHCWVANVRTIWVHLVIKHADDFNTADKELLLYRESDGTSEMAYKMWSALHAELAGTMTRIAEQGIVLAGRVGVNSGKLKYLWADAMATQLYDKFHS